MCDWVQKEALPYQSVGRASASQGGDALESNSGRFFGVVNIFWGVYYLPSPGMPGQEGGAGE